MSFEWVTYANIIATLALIISGVSLWKSWNVNKLDLIIKEQQVKEINDRTVPKLKFEIVNQFGKQYNLMVKNIGNATAYNVKIDGEHANKYLSGVEPFFNINLKSEEDFSPMLVILEEIPQILEFKFTWLDEAGKIYSETKSFDWLSSMPVSRIA